MDKYDLVVIGAGSGGVRAARKAAERGWRVAIVEDTHWGGTCVNVGCVPKKLMVYASQFSRNFADALEYGWELQAGTFDWPRFIANKNREIERLNGIYIKLLKSSGVTLIEGRGFIEGSNCVRVGDRPLMTERILIATGGEPSMPEVAGAELAITSDQVFFLPEQPKSCVIYGGGVIALEFACILAGLGTKVQLVYRGERLLREFDRDISDRMPALLTNLGVELYPGSDITGITTTTQGKREAMLGSGQRLIAEQVFYATGRRPRTRDLWSQDLQIPVKKNGALEVNAGFQTAVPSIYGIGDVLGHKALTPVALAEAMALVGHWFDGGTSALDYAGVPAAVFTQPAVGSVGLSEQNAAEQGIAVRVFETDFKPMQLSLTSRTERVYMKMLVCRATDRVLGLHIIAPDAGEIVQLAAVALQAKATKADFDRTIGIHPTIAEELVTLRQERVVP